MKTHVRLRMTAEDRAALFESQDGICAIPYCFKEARVVDHDHKTGAPRGALCYPHNSALGGFNDDPELMLEGIAYLRQFM